MGSTFLRFAIISLIALNFSCATKPPLAQQTKSTEAKTSEADPTAAPTKVRAADFFHDATTKETKVYLENGKPPVAILNSGISTECGIPDSKGYCKTTLFVDLPAGKKKIQSLKAGSDLALSGKPYGKVLKDLEIDAWDDQGGIIFLIQLKASDLDPTTIAERALEQKLSENKNDLTLKGLIPLLQKFKFRKAEILDGFRTYSLQENLSGNLVARTRLELYFQNEHLKYVLAHRPIKLTAVKKYPADSEYSIYALTADHSKKEADRIIFMLKSSN